MEIILLRRRTLCLLLHPGWSGQAGILKRYSRRKISLGSAIRWNILNTGMLCDNRSVLCQFYRDKARLIRSYSFAGVLGFLYSSHTRIDDAGCSYAPYFLPWNPVSSDKRSAGGGFFFPRAIDISCRYERILCWEGRERLGSMFWYIGGRAVGEAKMIGRDRKRIFLMSWCSVARSRFFWILLARYGLEDFSFWCAFIRAAARPFKKHRHLSTTHLKTYLGLSIHWLLDFPLLD